MKKVRFETPNKCVRLTMEDSECHSPRPFIQKQETTRPALCFDEYPRLLPYNPDPVQRYECSNSSPFPVVAKTLVENTTDIGSRWPSNDLELSMLDSSHCEPRLPMIPKRQICNNIASEFVLRNANQKNKCFMPINPQCKVLSSIENTKIVRAEANNSENNYFFIKRDNLNKINPGNINSLQSQLNRLVLNKENDPLGKKAELMRMVADNEPTVTIQPTNIQQPVITPLSVPVECRCHHCVKIIESTPCSLPKQLTVHNQASCHAVDNLVRTEQCLCMQHKYQNPCFCSHHKTVKSPQNKCSGQKTEFITDQPQNAVDKKTWLIEKYEQNRMPEGMEVEKQNNVTKDKREPTVSDLFKIIKLQNEQLQLLQEKVDKFISVSANRTPIQTYVADRVTLESADKEPKMSIGVMTSFEMVRTSTVINKEIVTQTNENAQIQCNRSQVSIKEVVSKSQPATLNFLDGIMPARRSAQVQTEDNSQNTNVRDKMQMAEYFNDDKTLNELSLYNVQVDNATTPLLSPEQSLYLDVRDYSGSETGSDDHSNVGWTYYNKVMTHVNGVLQDSEMPSSASALFRNTKQQCVQMHIDKTNVSVTKRVKFGDDPHGIHQPHLYAPTTDTSMKMNQLAAKYLKSGALSSVKTGGLMQVPVMTKPNSMPIEMSFATKNYMERHRIIQGNAMPSRSPPPGEIPRFLDITALKQQPKLL